MEDSRTLKDHKDEELDILDISEERVGCQVNGVEEAEEICQVNGVEDEEIMPLEDPLAIEPEKEPKIDKGVCIMMEELPISSVQNTDSRSGSDQQLPVLRRPRPKKVLLSEDKKSKGGDEGKTFADNPVDMCRIQCNICKKANFKVLRQHVRQHHDMSMKDFRKIYSETLFYKVTYHRYDNQKYFSFSPISMKFTMLSGICPSILGLRERDVNEHFKIQ